MSTPANKSRGEVALPEAGEGVVLRFDLDGLERLEGHFGADYLNVVMSGMAKARVPVFRAVLGASLDAGSAEQTAEALGKMPWGRPLEYLQGVALDALFLSTTGRTFGEQQKHEDEVFAQQLEEAKTNPRLAAALSLKLSEDPVIEPGSDQQNAAA